MMTITEIRQIFENPYDRTIWKGFLQKQFTNHRLNAEDRKILISDNTLSNQCVNMGNYEISEYSNIGIFEVQLKEKVNVAHNHISLHNLILVKPAAPISLP